LHEGSSAVELPVKIFEIRFQLANHLCSVNLELDGAGEIVSYEEYTPYDSTSYYAVRSQLGSPKRYRYTGQERDGESGFG
jgi:hypothetical protein